MRAKIFRGDKILQDSSRSNSSGKLIKPIVIILVVWLLAMTSLLGVHYYFKRAPKVRINKIGLLKIQAKYNALSDEDKRKIDYFEAGIIESADGDLFIVDDNTRINDQNLASGNGCAWRKIEYSIDDPLLFERKAMIREAINTLNNSEKLCLTDGRAAIIYKDGEYYLVIDTKTYADYVSKYGVECKLCEKRKVINKSKIGREEK